MATEEVEEEGGGYLVFIRCMISKAKKEYKSIFNTLR